MRIDVHAHYYPDEYLSAMQRLGINRTLGRGAPGAGVTLAERVDMLKEEDVDIQILCIGAEQPNAAEASEALALARSINDAYADIAGQYGGRFAAFGSVPLPHVDAAIEEAGRCLESLGMLGINVGCFVGKQSIDDPSFEPFLAELDRRRALLFLHPVGIGASPMTDAYGMNFMVGGCFEDTSVSVRLAMSGLIAKYPNVKIVVPHLGGTLPFLIDRVEEHMAREPQPWETDAVSPRSALHSLYFDTVNGSTAALRCACEVFGADRIMLGTDFPFQAGDRFKHQVRYVEQAGLSPSELDAIRGGTAARVISGLAVSS